MEVKKMTPHLSLDAARVWICCFGFFTVFAAHSQTSASHDWRYTVRPQDSVSDLTRQYLKPSISWQTLAKYNRLPDANVIYSGTQLRLGKPRLSSLLFLAMCKFSQSMAHGVRPSYKSQYKQASAFRWAATVALVFSLPMHPRWSYSPNRPSPWIP
jgi:hypothetical protein